ncbi:MAG: S41 family peptidase [Gemmatimonadaceae bacterium]
MRRHRVVLLLLLAAAGGALIAAQRPRAAGSGRLLEEVLSLTSHRFVDSLGDGQLLERAARGLVEELGDPYSELYSPEQLKAFEQNTGGRYAGLGMLVEQQGTEMRVAKVYPNTPAERGGVLEGDLVAGVNGHATTGWALAQLTDSLKGTPGTSVRVELRRVGVPAPIAVSFVRSVVRVPAVPYAIVLAGGVGYVPIQQINETAAAEARRAVASLVARGATGLVLDLRGDGGGYVDQAVDIANLFLPKGSPVFEVRGREGVQERVAAVREPLAAGVPVVVLVDGSTASASEIVAGALQDHDRALVLGTPSFGKGLVQSLYPLEDGWALKLTTGRWYTPSGRTIHRDRLPSGEPAPMRLDSADRPVYRTDAGRPLQGGGGIAPDVRVAPDTLTSAERAFVDAIAPQTSVVYRTLYAFALELKSAAPPSGGVRAEWRAELHRRLAAQGVKVPRERLDSAGAYVDQLLGMRVARFAYGDSGAMRRYYREDVPLARAVALLENARTTRELFERVASR